MILINDFRVLVKGLIAAYPRENFMPNEYTMNLWYNALHDLDYPTLNKAIQSYIMSNKYPPTIADIRQLAYDLTAPADNIASEEWSRLITALGHAGSPEAPDCWNRLPEITKEIVGSFSEYRQWSLMPTVDLMSIQRPMFIKRYEEKERIRRLRGAVPSTLNPPAKQLEGHGAARIEDKGRSGSNISHPNITRDEAEKTHRERRNDIEALKRRLLYGKENGGKAGEDHGD